MHYLKYVEDIHHKTGDLPLAFYDVDEHHPRYVMRSHWHRETEILRVVSGSLHLYADVSTIEVSAGETVIIGGSVLHGCDPVDCHYQCLVFDPNALLMHFDSCKRVATQWCSGVAALRDTNGAVERLFTALETGIESHVMTVIGGLYEVFGSLPELTAAERSAATERNDMRAEQLKPALEYIEQNYSSHISLETLARLTGLSAKYFCRCFKAVTHRSPIDYLNHYRVECAGYCLSTTDMTVAEVAQSCGFNDSSFFIKQFKHYKQFSDVPSRTL
ncbi:MAG: AraC family transcriptional regulator, partial [Clostridia bacterium]|nr:AraC family transcriptional regulator [Clostridia bacterium]